MVKGLSTKYEAPVRFLASKEKERGKERNQREIAKFQS